MSQAKGKIDKETTEPATPAILTPAMINARIDIASIRRIVATLAMTPAPLVNANFDAGFYKPDPNVGEIEIAEGWAPYYKASTGEPGILHRPEYKPEKVRIRAGTGQKWFTTFSTHSGGIMQAGIPVPVDSRLFFSVYGQIWSADGDDWQNPSGMGGYGIKVGIDPKGGNDPWAAAVVWGDWESTYTQPDGSQWNGTTWRQIVVDDVIAQAETVTVFIHGQADHKVKHNDAYIDQAALYYTGGDPDPIPPIEGGILEMLDQAIADNAAVGDQLTAIKAAMVTGAILAIPLAVAE